MSQTSTHRLKVTRDPAAERACDEAGGLRDGAVVPLAALREGLSRRGFCATAGIGLAAAALPACFGGSGSDSVSWGPLDNVDAGPAGIGLGSRDMAAGRNADLARGNGNPSRDMARSQQQDPQDLAQPADPPDLAQPKMNANSCSGGEMDTGKPPGAFGMNTATYFGNAGAFVCRDAGGLFAMSALCPHAGAKLQLRNGGFWCNRHGATFDYDGQHPTIPAFSPLDHYPICLSNGNVAFDPNNTVDVGFRLNA